MDVVLVMQSKNKGLQESSTTPSPREGAIRMPSLRWTIKSVKLNKIVSNIECGLIYSGRDGALAGIVLVKENLKSKV